MKEQLSILLVDDDNTDALLFKRAIEHLKLTNPVVHLPDCREALEYLMNPENPKPWVVLTDLNTPKMNGIELIKEVKNNESLKQTIIIVLSGSGDPTDIAECFRCGAAGYMVKPSNHKQLIEMIRAIHTYWALSEFPCQVEDLACQV